MKTFTTNSSKNLLRLALSVVIIIAFSSHSFSQKIFGVASEEGPKGGGTIFSLDPSGESFNVEHAFELPDGLPNSILLGQDGHYYGGTYDGGLFNMGTISRISADGTDKTVLHHFEGGHNGEKPFRHLVQDEQGYIYGTADGGSEDSGLIFRISTAGEYTILYHFDKASISGGNPWAGLLLHSDGKLYGINSSSLGGRGNGAIFSIERDGSGFTVLKPFDDFSNGRPNSALLEGQDGLLYGYSDGGPGLYGFIYRIASDGTNFEIIHIFDRENEGSSPDSDLLQSSSGYLYGMTTQGGIGDRGTIFRLDPEEGELEVLFALADYPNSSLHVDRSVLLLGGNDNLYGLARSQRFYPVTSLNDNSEIFRLDPETKQLSIISDLETPSGFIWANNIGILESEVIIGLGSILQEVSELVFTLNLDGSALDILYQQQNQSPHYPYSRLLESSTGRLYGTTLNGGTGSGTIFRINADGSGFSVLRNLNLSQDGDQPNGGLIEGSDGYLYGMTSFGGTHLSGTIYKMSKDGTEFTILRHFHPETDGARPNGELVEGPDGLLYGVATNGGPEGHGTLFQVSKSGEFKVIENFSSENGRKPNGSLTIGSEGLLYGYMTEAHSFTDPLTGIGSDEGEMFNKGIIYSIDFTGNDFKVLYERPFSWEGSYPVDRLLEGEPGIFYGIMVTGPNDLDSYIENGLVFKFSLDNLQFEILQKFELEEDGVPYGGLAIDEQGNLYGGTEINFLPNDPENQAGVIFKLSAGDYEYEVLRRMNEPIDGKNVRFLTIVQSKIDDCPLIQLDSIVVDSGKRGLAGSTVRTRTTLPEQQFASATWHWGDGQSSTAVLTDTTITGAYKYESSGLYTISLELVDDCGKTFRLEKELYPVYDPEDGSLTGGGWFHSPKGAYIEKPQSSGKAHFAITARYQRHEKRPSGNFTFRTSDFRFQSTYFNWLIIDEEKAMLQGVGKVNGRGNFGFLVTAVERDPKGDVSGKIRVRIWNRSRGDLLVYDNMLDGPIVGLPETKLGGGNISVHDRKSGKDNKDKGQLIEELLKKVKAYPNPVRDIVHIDLGELSIEEIETILTDAYGNMELRNLHRVSGSNQIELDLSALKSGFYYIQIRTVHGYRSIKLLKR